jgi:uncharacterized protein
MPDYRRIDRSPALSYIFYPRRESAACPENAFELALPVDPSTSIGCRFYPNRPQDPWIIFFHGNGEIAADYDDIAPLYQRYGLNLVVADYRGYGISGGVPTMTDLTRDAVTLFPAITRELDSRQFTGQRWVMGRSLGSLSAIEVASQYGQSVRGLIVESGFISVARIIRHLRLAAQDDALEEIDRECVSRVRSIVLPALIIHGEDDTLVPLKEAEDLYATIGSVKKQLLTIPRAGHNDLLYRALPRYFEAIKTFIE